MYLSFNLVCYLFSWHSASPSNLHFCRMTHFAICCTPAPNENERANKKKACFNKKLPCSTPKDMHKTKNMKKKPIDTIM